MFVVLVTAQRWTSMLTNTPVQVDQLIRIAK